MPGARKHNLTLNSQKLRKNMTKEERHLWYDFLKELPIIFRRQKVIGRFIVDFYCASAKLVVELDGSQHYDEKCIQDDILRDEYLSECGLTVKRYSNADVNQRFDSVCTDIYDFVQNRLPPPREAVAAGD